MPLPTGVYRADHVGSFLRPKALLAARAQAAAGELTPEKLRELEDSYIADVVSKQRAAGLRSVTDGEFRRQWFHVDFLKHLSGVELRGAMSSTAASVDGTTPPRLVVVDKIAHPQPIQVADYNYLSSRIASEDQSQAQKDKLPPATAKVCIPSPTMVHFRNSRDTISEAAYPVLEPAFFDDLARVFREELADLYAAGARFVQLDDTNLAYLCDPQMRAEAEARHQGLSGDALARQYAALINAAIAERPADLKIGIHLCRGNHRSRWFAQGGYEPVAEVLFRDLNVDAYFLEYDDARSGDFSPLRHLPPHKTVVLGVMSSKTGALDDRAEVVRRLREAASFCPRGLDQLCLSHQCGFSSTSEGNELSEEEQWAKVRLEVEIAKEVWGEDLSV
ncbi:methionine synthase-like protein [Camillea tinctor]|nr:methionine synthase-like protein [Camillea tinctor]